MNSPKLVTILCLLVLAVLPQACKSFTEEQTEDLQTECSQGKIPFIPLPSKFLEEGSLRSDRSIDNSLGMGYKAFSYPLASTRNTTFRVIDIESLSQNRKLKDIITVKGIYESQSHYYTYTSFQEYVQKISKKMKNSTRLSASFLGFVKTEFSADYSLMTEDIDRESEKHIFGTIQHGVKTESYALNLINPKQIYNFLSYKFKHDYYNNAPEDIIKYYGPYVLTAYDAGGFALGTYKACTKESMTEHEKKKCFELMMKFSFSKISKKIGGIDFEHETSKDQTDYDKYKKEFDDFQLAFKTIGGNPAHGIPDFVGPLGPENLKIDLHEWGKTVVEPRFYQISEIHQEGLTPIYTFIQEDNIQKHYKAFQEDGLSIRTRKPFFLYDCGIYGVDVHIVSRFGDLIKISNGKEQRISDGAWFDGMRLKPRRPSCDEFPILFTPWYKGDDPHNKSMPAYVPDVRRYPKDFVKDLYSYIPYPSKLMYDLTECDKESQCVYRLKDDPAEIRYLYLKTPKGEFALAIFDEYIDELYGLDIKDLPVKEVSSDYLKHLKILAL